MSPSGLARPRGEGVGSVSRLARPLVQFGAISLVETQRQKGRAPRSVYGLTFFGEECLRLTRGITNWDYG